MRASVIPPVALAGIVLHADPRAQSAGGAYTIPAHAIAAGGGRSIGGPFALEGTIAQHALSPPATGGPFVFVPGFRRQRVAIPDGLFSDGFESP